MPSLHPYAPVARSSAPMSALPEPPHGPVGHVPLSTRVPTVLVPWLSAHLQRPHRAPAASEHAPAGVLDPRHLSVVSRLFVAAHRARTGGPCPHELSMVLV